MRCAGGGGTSMAGATGAGGAGGAGGGRDGTRAAGGEDRRPSALGSSHPPSSPSPGPPTSSFAALLSRSNVTHGVDGCFNRYRRLLLICERWPADVASGNAAPVGFGAAAAFGAALSALFGSRGGGSLIRAMIARGPERTPNCGARR